MFRHALLWEGLRAIMSPSGDRNGFLRHMETEYRKDFDILEKNLGRKLTAKDAKNFLDSN